MNQNDMKFGARLMVRGAGETWLFIAHSEDGPICASPTNWWSTVQCRYDEILWYENPVMYGARVRVCGRCMVCGKPAPQNPDGSFAAGCTDACVVALHASADPENSTIYVTMEEHEKLALLEQQCRGLSGFDNRKWYDGVKALLGSRCPPEYTGPHTIEVLY